jgi:hypothetical protein
MWDKTLGVPFRAEPFHDSLVVAATELRSHQPFGPPTGKHPVVRHVRGTEAGKALFRLSVCLIQIDRAINQIAQHSPKKRQAIASFRHLSRHGFIINEGPNFGA